MKRTIIIVFLDLLLLIAIVVFVVQLGVGDRITVARTAMLAGFLAGVASVFAVKSFLSMTKELWIYRKQRLWRERKI